MNILIDKLRKERQKKITVGGKTFIIRRPTDRQIVELPDNGIIPQSYLLQRFVVGWENMKEMDIIPGGTGEAVEFNSELFVEWSADQPEIWAPLCDAITALYKEHSENLEMTKKKQETG